MEELNELSTKLSSILYAYNAEMVANALARALAQFLVAHVVVDADTDTVNRMETIEKRADVMTDILATVGKLMPVVERALERERDGATLN